MKSNLTIWHEYLTAVESGPEVAGDYAATLTDDQAESLYNSLVDKKLPYLVKTLWYNYNTQSFRFTLKAGAK